MEIQNRFERYELKYLVTKKQKTQIMEAMEPYMCPDEFGRSTIRNIYYDTSDSLLIRRSLEKPVYKEKLRVRSYSRATADSTVFIELKKKYESVVYKRRVSVTEAEAMNYLNRGETMEFHNQITEEIDYFRKMYPGLRPAVFLSYEREAFYGKEDRELRITFDENILWRDNECTLRADIYGTPVLEPGYSLMEIKVAQAIPMWLVRALSQARVYQTSISKYGEAYKQMVRKQQKEAVVTKRFALALQAKNRKNSEQRRKEVSYVG